MQTSVYIAGMTCRLHIKDGLIPVFQIDTIPSTILTFFFDIDINTDTVT